MTEAPSSPSAPTAGLWRRNRLKLVPVLLLVAVVLGGGLWTLATLKFSYSAGDRIGYVQKLSRKGWVCRTWEGELAMTPVPGAAPQIFAFTIPKTAVAMNIQNLEGKKVALHYEEKRGVPSSCFGDTRYFVTDIRLLSP